MSKQSPSPNNLHDTGLEPEALSIAPERVMGQRFKKFVGVGMLMLSVGGIAGAAKNAYDAAFSPTDIKIGPHAATVQLTHDHTESLDVGPIGSISRNTSWPMSTGVAIELKAIPDPPKSEAVVAMTGAVINQYSELVSSNHLGDEVRHAVLSNIKEEAISGGITGASVGLVVFGGGLLATTRMSERRRSAIKEAAYVSPKLLLRTLAFGSMGVAIALNGTTSNAQSLETHVVKQGDPQLAGTFLQGFTVHGFYLELAVGTLAPLITEQRKEIERYYAQGRTNFELTFKQKFGQSPLNHNGIIWVQGTSDDHCNIGINTVNEAVTIAFKNNLTLDSGDLAASGSSIESLCVSEYAHAIVPHNPAVEALGNHDSPVIGEMAKKHGMVVLDDNKLHYVGGLTLLGRSDVNASTFMVPLHVRGTETPEQEAESIRAAACALHPDIVVAHEQGEAMPTAKSGCVKEVRYGHDHVYAAPYLVENSNGGTIAHDPGTSGGAAPDKPTILKLNIAATQSECAYIKQTKRMIGCYRITMNPDTSVEISDFQPAPNAPVATSLSPVLASR